MAAGTRHAEVAGAGLAGLTVAAALAHRELRASLRKGIGDLFTRYGVTTVGEISNSRDGLTAVDEILSGGDPPIRVVIHLWSPGTLSLEEACHWRAHLSFAAAPDRLRVEAVKIFVDGGFSACNAATLQRYRGPHAIHPGSRGHLNLRRDQLVRMITATHEAGLQMAVHANGERAQIAVCDAAERAAAALSATPRVRLEHGGNFITHDATLEAWEAADVTAIAQPGFLYNFFGDFLPDYLGSAGTHGRLRCASCSTVAGTSRAAPTCTSAARWAARTRCSTSGAASSARASSATR